MVLRAVTGAATVATEFTPDVLVVGATSGGSLGSAIVDELNVSEWSFGKVYTAGITDEEIRLDLLRGLKIGDVLAEYQPDIVVCTVGINQPVDVTDPSLPAKLYTAFSNNVTGPMDLLRHFVVSPVRPERAKNVKKFVAISSNSARIPRRNSVAYCASKAALSMALRVAARELAGQQVAVWGYEPGLLAGTPMTQNTERDFPPGAVLHRMKGVPLDGIPPADLARRIVQDLATFSYAHNGLIVPFDAGEL